VRPTPLAAGTGLRQDPAMAAQPTRRDLDLVVERACAVWDPAAAVVWLRSPNAHLDHARPLDVLALRGPDEVLAALDAEEAGSYA
jgi:uncharacterized protein (DUF2384 family)